MCRERGSSGVSHGGEVNPLDGLVGRHHDGAATLAEAVLPPEGLRQLRLVVLQALRRPLLKRRQRDALRLGRAVGARAWLGEVLLVVALRTPRGSGGLRVGERRAQPEKRAARWWLIRAQCVRGEEGTTAANR